MWYIHNEDQSRNVIINMEAKEYSMIKKKKICSEVMPSKAVDFNNFMVLEDGTLVRLVKI